MLQNATKAQCCFYPIIIAANHELTSLCDFKLEMQSHHAYLQRITTHAESTFVLKLPTPINKLSHKYQHNLNAGDKFSTLLDTVE